MDKKSLLFFLLLIFPLHIFANSLDIESYLLIHDYAKAAEVAAFELKKQPDNLLLWQQYITALAKNENENEMIIGFNQYLKVFPDEIQNRDIIETVAFGVLKKAENSSSPIIRILTTLSGFFSQDAKGIEIVLKGLKDPNSAVRQISLKMASHLQDDPAKAAVYELFKNERVWKIRLEAISALGSMKVQKAHPDLMQLLNDSQLTAEETLVTIQALVELTSEIEDQHLDKLVHNDRASLRRLACLLVVHLNKNTSIDKLYPLINDDHPDVRKEVLTVLSLLKPSHIGSEDTFSIAKKMVTDRDPEVAIYAAALLSTYEPELAEKYFYKWIQDSRQNIRLKAAAYMATFARYTTPQMVKFLSLSNDPYVKINLSLGLIGQRTYEDRACHILFQGLTTLKDKWMFSEEGLANILTATRFRNKNELDLSPDLTDQITRLDVLNRLSILRYPQVETALRQFLKEKSWGVSSMAMASLLTEGAEESIGVVESLLDDKEEDIRVQAALTLALWGGSDKALATLYKSYEIADRETKEKILEGILKVASPSSIPFLLKQLQEPYQSLRIIAAAAIIICLYS